jgi:ACS family glucarate transporter-like MFS transporter
MQVTKASSDAFVLPNAAVMNPTRVRFKVLAMLCALASLTYLDRMCISAAAPAISSEFHFTKSQMGYIFSAFTFAYAVFEIPSGWFGDYFGTRKALTRIVLWWSAFTALTAATVGFKSLFFVRLMFGAGEAGAIPNSASTVARWFPTAQKGRAMGAICMGHALGAAATPPLVFKLVEWQGWRLTFVEFGAIGILWCIAWYVWFRNTPEEHSDVNADEVKLIHEGSTVSQQHSHKIPWKSFLKSKNIFFLCAMYFAYGYSLYFYITWLPTYLVEARGFTTGKAGFYSALPWIFGGFAFFCGGWLTDWLVIHTNRKIARCGVGAFGLSMSALMLVFVARTENSVLAAWLIAVALYFQFLTTPAVWATCMDIGQRMSGIVSGTTNTFGNLSGTLAPIVFGYVVDKWHSWTIPFYVAAIFLAVGVIMWFFIDPRRPLEESVLAEA